MAGGAPAAPGTELCPVSWSPRGCDTRAALGWLQAQVVTFTHNYGSRRERAAPCV